MRISILLFGILLGAATFAHAETIATVNGVNITDDELQRALQEFAAGRGAHPADLRNSPRFAQLREALVISLVERELLWQTARRDYQASDAQVDDALARVRSQLGGAERLRRALQAQGLSEDQLAQRLRRDLAIQAYLQQEVYADVEVDEAEIRRFYDQNQASFRSPDLLRLRHILFAATAGADAQQRAAEVRQKLTEGADFAQMARKHSADFSARHGGELGFLNAADLGPQLAPVAGALAPGAVSEPQAGADGIHILQLLSRRPGIQAPLAEVHDRIATQLREARRNEALGQRLAALRKDANIELQP